MAARKCNICGADSPADLMECLCPKCVLKQVLAEEDDADAPDSAGAPPVVPGAAEGQPGTGALGDAVSEKHGDRIGRYIQSVPHWLLWVIAACALADSGDAIEANPISPILINEILPNNRSFTNTYGVAADWVELHNPTTASLDLCGMSFSDTMANPRRWSFPANSVIGPGGYLLIQFDSTAPASGVNTGFGLNADGDALYLLASPAAGGGVVDSIAFGCQAADQTIGRVGPDRQWSLCQPTYGLPNVAVTLGDPRQLKINEWMARPVSGSDWFEIFNPLPQPVALGGLFLSDNLTNWFQFQVRNLSFMGTGNQAYQVFYADEATALGPMHVNFRLSSEGEGIGLFKAAGAVIDSVAFGPQQAGVSEGRLPDGTSSIAQFVTSASPGKRNFLPVMNVVINEVLTHTDPPLEDAIELHNPADQPVDVGGWYLSDSRGDPKKYRIPAGTVIQPHGYVMFYEYQFNPLPGIWPSFELSSSQGDWTVLSAADAAGNLTGANTAVQFSPIENGISIGRHVTSTGVDFVPLARRTFGVDSPPSLRDFRRGTGLTNAEPRVGPVVISELMFSPDTHGPAGTDLTWEYIELQNITSVAVPLQLPDGPTSVWRLAGAVEYDFPTNASLPPGGFLVVVGFDPRTDVAALSSFMQHYGMTNRNLIYGPSRGRLNNAGERIVLWKSIRADWSLVFVEAVQYTNQAPWPKQADGTGLSLQRIDANLYGNEPLHWKADLPTPGAPAPVGPVTRDSDGDGMPDIWEWLHQLDPLDAADAALDADHDGMTNWQEYRCGTDPRDSTSSLRLTVEYHGQALRLRFLDTARLTYRLQLLDMVAGGPWLTLTNLSGSASGLPLEAADDQILERSSRFYRLILNE